MFRRSPHSRRRSRRRSPLGEADRGPEQVGHARAGAGRLVAQAQGVERVETRRGRRALVGEQALEQPRQRRVLVQIGKKDAHLGERRVWLRELLVQRGRDAQAQLAGLGAGQHLQPEPPRRDQLGPALVSFQQALERRRDLAVGGPQPEQLLQVADRARVIADEVLGDPGRLLEDLGAAIEAARDRQPRVVGVQHVAPALGHRQRHDQRAERPVGVRRGLQDGAQHLDRFGRALAEAVGREAGRAMRQHVQDRLRDVRRDVPAVEVEQAPRLPLVGHDGRFQRLPRRLVARLRRRGGERGLEPLVRRQRHGQQIGILDRDDLHSHGRGSFSGQWNRQPRHIC